MLGLAQICSPSQQHYVTHTVFIARWTKYFIEIGTYKDTENGQIITNVENKFALFLGFAIAKTVNINSLN